MNETTRADIAIIGTGPAGVSAAITARVRGKQVLLFGNEGLTTKMTKAHTIRNYPGLPDITGTDLADKLKHHLDVMGVEITEKQSRPSTPWAVTSASRRRILCMRPRQSFWRAAS